MKRQPCENHVLGSRGVAEDDVYELDIAIDLQTMTMQGICHFFSFVQDEASLTCSRVMLF